ncbi:MAG: 50S ribosomal protein L30e [Petrotogales bacterium]
MVDVNKVLKDLAKKGKIKIGKKQTMAAINNGDAKLVVISNNCPYSSKITALATEKKAPVYNYSLNGVELGYACGKNFVVSSFAVIDEGECNIKPLITGRK